MLPAEEIDMTILLNAAARGAGNTPAGLRAALRRFLSAALGALMAAATYATGYFSRG